MPQFRLFEINREYHDDIEVAWADSRREIDHYAFVYAQDGDVRIEEYIEGGWKPIATLRKRKPFGKGSLNDQ